MEWFKDLIELISHKPWIIFVVLTLAFGYAYYDQNTNIATQQATYVEELGEQNVKIQELSLEVGGLRTGLENMNEIIILKVALAEAAVKAAALAAARECPIEE